MNKAVWRDFVPPHGRYCTDLCSDSAGFAIRSRYCVNCPGIDRALERRQVETQEVSSATQRFPRFAATCGRAKTKKDSLSRHGPKRRIVSCAF